IHGGGWTLGDLDSEDGVCRLMCSQARVVVISPDYRLAPEYPYPICFSDSWETLLWTIKNSEDLGIDASQVIIAGSSAGGNLVSAVVHQARVENVMLAGQILRIPSTCHIDLLPSEGLSSMVENADAPLLSRRSMEIFWSNYNPPKDKLLHHTVSPLLASTFKGLPPTYVQVAGLDPLRDEGLRYAKRLLEAGVPMKLDVYPGVPHAFGYFPELDAAKANARDLIQGLQWIKSLK
ncbi:Alpha/beta hydrolase fold-3, partial [Cadophora sp. DSE1049]